MEVFMPADTVMLDIDDIEATTDKSVLFSFPKLNCKRWVSRKYFEPLPHAIKVPLWYFKKYIKPTNH
jgi:hypothetical protein